MYDRTQVIQSRYDGWTLFNEGRISKKR